MGYVDLSIKAVSINGVAPTQEHAKSGAYPVVRSKTKKANPNRWPRPFTSTCKRLTVRPSSASTATSRSSDV